LQGVAEISSHDVWTVGAWWNPLEVHPMIAHWDGAGWKSPSLPTLPTDTYLGGIDALGANDIWAIGSTETSFAKDTLATPSILHYGGQDWQTAPVSDLPQGIGNDIDGIDMRTATDGWVVGETGDDTEAQPLILRWQGARWVGSAAPRVALGYGNLVAVSAASATDVWAVGSQTDVTGRIGATTGLVMHFDGRSWSTVRTPMPDGSKLDAVAVAGPGDVWASGADCSGPDCVAAVWHLSSGTWQQVPLNGGTEATALVAFGPGNVWSLGYQLLPDNSKSDHVEHWTGKSFTYEDTGLPPLPPKTNPRGELGSATPIWAATGDRANGQLWAVGWSNPPGITPRVIHRC
jgi:hypothetical protein